MRHRLDNGSSSCSSRNLKNIACLLLILSASFVEPSPAQQAQPPQGKEEAKSQGVVVERIDEKSALAIAGVQQGDRLLHWKSLSNPREKSGELATAFDLLYLEIEEAPRGVLEITARRGEEEHRFAIKPAGSWDIRGRPEMPKGVLTSYREGTRLLEAGRLEEGERSWADLIAKESNQAIRFWVSHRLGNVWIEQKQWQRAEMVFREALKESYDAFTHSFTWQAIGRSLARQNELEAATAAYQESLSIRLTEWGGESLLAAESYNDLAMVAWQQGDLDTGEVFLEKVFIIRERLAPKSVWFAAVLNNLGALAAKRGRLEEADQFLRRSLAIKEDLAPGDPSLISTLDTLGAITAQLSQLETAEEFHLRALKLAQDAEPDSRSLATILHNLGYVKKLQGDLEAAMDYYERSIELHSQLAAGGLEIAGTLSNLGVIASDQGHLARSLQYYHQALEIRERINPEGIDVASSFHNLGSVAWKQGITARAKYYHERALSIRRALAPGGLEVANSLNSLGVVARSDNDLYAAETYFRESLEIRNSLAPSSYWVAVSQMNLAIVARERGDFLEARRRLDQASTILLAIAPGSLKLARSYRELGLTARAEGDLAEARMHLNKALELQDELAPQSILVAETLYALGHVELLRPTPKHAEALEYFEKSIILVEKEAPRVGESLESLSHFRAQKAEIFKAALGQQLHLGRPEAAFHLSERLRARTFLEALQERNLSITDSTEDLDHQRRILRSRYARKMAELGRLNIRDHADEIRAIRQQLRVLEWQTNELAGRIRTSSPQLAALRYPESLDTVQARKALDPGTLLLSYVVDKSKLTIFALSRDQPLAAKSVDLGESDLSKRIERFRGIIHQTARGGQYWLDGLRSEGQHLFRLLLAPFEDRLLVSARLLIIPDGPLHLLPFAAVLDETERYLIERLPIHLALSATVASELKNARSSRSRNEDEGLIIAAFGDPAYQQSLGDQATSSPRWSQRSAEIRSARARGLLDWSPLPYSRREVETIVGLFPEAQRELFLGASAREESLKDPSLQPRFLHLATHARVDEDLPSSSFVALTPTIAIREAEEESTAGGKLTGEDGLLQMWEIVEEVRLQSDLVTLSACETGLGKRLDNEGLLSLTRAFQIAGARSVAASLWSVSDLSTSELMIRFYKNLRKGMPKIEALRAAQLELIRQPVEITEDGAKHFLDATAPYHWASFQIHGDWR